MISMPMILQVIQEQWGRDLISSWNKHDWIGLPQKIGADLASLLGAEKDEVIVADSTSINIFKTVSAALDLRPDRNVIISGKYCRTAWLFKRRNVCASVLACKHWIFTKFPSERVYHRDAAFPLQLSLAHQSYGLQYSL